MGKESVITGFKGRDRFIFFMLCLFTAFFSVLYPMLSGRGLFFIEGDLATQQIPFTTYLSEMIRQGIDTWSWDVDLGSSTIQAFSFYELGSPFFWLISLFPQRFTPYLIGWGLILKYVVACYTAQMFLKRFTKTPWSAVPGALLYAFSGYQSTNIVFHFHSVTALFPLLLVGLEYVMDDTEPEKKTKYGLFFAGTVCINALANYFFFVQSVIILVFYYLFRFSVLNNPKRMMCELPRILFYGLLGSGMAAILLMPNYYYILQNPRSSESVLGSVHRYSLNQFMYIIKGLILPGDNMCDETMFMRYRWSSTSAYLPFVSYCFVFAYLLKKRDWLTYIILTFILMSLLPQTNSLFLLFTIDYQRWWYGLIILTSLATVLVLENPNEYPIKKSVCIQTGLLVILSCYSLVARDYLFNYGGSALYHPGRYILLLLMSFPGMVYAWLINSHEQMFFRKLSNRIVLLGCISVFSVITTFYCEYSYKNTGVLKDDQYQLMIKLAEDYPAIEAEYRYRNYQNINIFYSTKDHTTGLRTFTSTASTALFHLDALFDFYAPNRTLEKNGYAGLPEMLGGKYLLVSDVNFDEDIPRIIIEKGEEAYRYTSNGVECVVKTYPAAKIGYRVKNYITEEELYKLPVRFRGVALLYAPCVKDDETGRRCGLEPVSAEEITQVIEKYPDHAKDDALLVSPILGELCDRNNAEHVKYFNKDIHGFTAETEYMEDSAVFFSIPADEGWHITIDGEKADFTDAGGLMLINVPGGEHMIRGEYHCPYFREGCIISAVFTVLFAVLCVFRRKLLI